MPPILLALEKGIDAKPLVDALKAHRYDDVQILSDGKETLDYLHRRGAHAARQAPDPAVVVLDLKIPQIDGLDVLQAMKTDRRLRTIPIIMLTPSTDERNVLARFKIGVSAYLVEPVDRREFIAAIEQALPSKPSLVDGG